MNLWNRLLYTIIFRKSSCIRNRWHNNLCLTCNEFVEPSQDFLCHGTRLVPCWNCTVLQQIRCWNLSRKADSVYISISVLLLFCWCICLRTYTPHSPSPFPKLRFSTEVADFYLFLIFFRSSLSGIENCIFSCLKVEIVSAIFWNFLEFFLAYCIGCVFAIYY